MPDLSIVQAMGSIGYEAMSIDFRELARTVGEKFGAHVYYLNAPAILGSGTALALAAANPSIQESLHLAHSADMYVVGVGSIESDLFLLAWADQRRGMDHLVQSGAVGDICGRFFDHKGREITQRLADRVVGIELADLRRSQWAVAVAGGADKVVPLLGALRGQMDHMHSSQTNTRRASLLDLSESLPQEEE